MEFLPQSPSVSVTFVIKRDALYQNMEKKYRNACFILVDKSFAQH